MTLTTFLSVLSTLEAAYPTWNAPVVTLIAQHSHDPFRVLISTILSLRTKDETTAKASERLFARADTPEAMETMTPGEIEEAIYPVGFYKNKAKQIIRICHRLSEQYDGQVPDDLETLLTFNGVGRKTANLVLGLGFGIPAVCVDVHVHRILNRMDFVRTKTPEETEMAIRRKVPRTHWIRINDVLVAFGQTLCKPVSPFCSRCPVYDHCPRKGVTTRR